MSGTSTEYAGYLLLMLKQFTPRVWLLAVLAAMTTGLLIALPAALIDNPVFGRQLAARPQDYVFLGTTMVLAGIILASFAVSPSGGAETRVTAGGFLSFLAVGCPVCNKIVVAAIGTSGALSFFEPAQLLLGIAAVALLGWSLLLRARAVAGYCALPA